jgi:hypothetical protein
MNGFFRCRRFVSGGWRLPFQHIVGELVVNILELVDGLDVGKLKILVNGLRLCKEADFGAQNCQNTTKVEARYNVQLTTESAFLPNTSWMQYYEDKRFRFYQFYDVSHQWHL